VRGSIKWQVSEIFNRSGINQIGQSKHSAKEIARQNGAQTWHQVGQHLGVHSYATADAYRDVWRQVAAYTREVFATKDLEKLTSEHIASFLQSKIESGVSRATYQQYSAACQKLESSLNKFAENKGTDRTYDFQPAFAALGQSSAKLQKFEGARSYDRPTELISKLVSASHQIAAKIQNEGGARLRETALIRTDQLIGNNTIHLDKVSTKGGKERDIRISPETYLHLQNHISQHGTFKINYNQYRHDLRQAAEETSQKYQGSHGLRWCYAQNRMAELQKNGRTYEQGLSRVSSEMGHVRGDITEHYLQ